MKTWPLLLLSVVRWIRMRKAGRIQPRIRHHGILRLQRRKLVDFTVGELAVATTEFGSTLVSQRFRKLCGTRIHPRSARNDAQHPRIPNPTTGHVNIEIGGDDALDLTAIVYDGYGNCYIRRLSKPKIFR